jgi:hypothetical protein
MISFIKSLMKSLEQNYFFPEFPMNKEQYDKATDMFDELSPNEQKFNLQISKILLVIPVFIFILFIIISLLS